MNKDCKDEINVIIDNMIQMAYWSGISKERGQEKDRDRQYSVASKMRDKIFELIEWSENELKEN